MAVKDELKTNNLNHRHDFLMNYYNMAVDDLDRFLKIGIETITSLAGFVVVISFGFKGELPLTLSICFGITLLGWGWGNIIDSNYWAIRAISFLSNIEAVYFKMHERKYFNPYIGSYPPYKIISGLSNQIFLLVIFLIISFIISFNPIFDNITNNNLLIAIKNISYIKLIYYSSPFILILSLLFYINFRYLARAKDYLLFMQECSGPGLIDDFITYRTVDLKIIGDETKLIDGTSLQSQNITETEKKIKTLKRLKKLLLIGGIILLILGYASIIIFKQLKI